MKALWLLFILASGIAMSTETTLQQQLQAALAAKGPDYRPRTQLLNADGSPKYTNRLILESSPYLLQHAHNPVNWRAWNAETFAEARRLNRPIFLSIGYSTCHWCHVMEEESFDNEAVAEVLNRHYIAIKVDREQLPDVDSIYMQAVMAMQGHGGWPLNVFLTPEGEPFYGGTYFPRQPFIQLLQQIADLWQNRRDELLQQARGIREHLQQRNRTQKQNARLDASVVQRAVRQANSAWDDLDGGFGQAPKFPHEVLLQFLLNTAWLEENDDDRRALEPALHSIRHMAAGGIFDQIGGGWHRYATDSAWLIPHFEKMLYNQAQMALALADAIALEPNPWLVDVLERTLNYTLREMRRDDGLFYSASDADSEGEEGKFFVWHYQELQTALGDAFGQAQSIYDIRKTGNWEGVIIPALLAPADELAEKQQRPLPALLAEKRAIDQRLYPLRKKRIPPATDHKMITAWNAMLLQAFARAGARLGRSDWLDVAEQGLDRLWALQYRQETGLRRIHLQGEAAIPAILDDHAQFIQAMLELQHYRPDNRWLQRSRTLAEALQAFADPIGGFFMDRPQDDGTPAISRVKEGADGALPSGNAAAVLALADLYQATGDTRWKAQAEATLAAFSEEIRPQPMLFPGLLLGRQRLKGWDGRPVVLAAGGKLRVSIARKSASSGELRLQLPAGWHVNAPQPGVEGLVGLSLRALDGTRLNLQWPAAQSQPTGFSEQALQLFSGEIVLPFHWTETRTWLALELQFQACDLKQCLPPEQLRLLLPAWRGEITTGAP